MSGDLLSLAEAQARLLALTPRLAEENRSIAEASGYYLRNDLIAGATRPEADTSAMDGFAARAADLPGPWTVIGESAAGLPFAGEVGAGEAVRIATGGVVPAGCDMVLVQEDCRRDGDRLALTGEPPSPPGRHIRRQGMDFRAGETVLPAGVRLGPAQLALALAAGHRALPVRRAPTIAVIDSGDELVGEAGGRGMIPATNGPMLAAMLGALPCAVTRIGPIADSRKALADAFAAASAADIVVTSGGASVGDHDLVRPALEAWGARLEFWRVAIKPGKPLLVARRGGQLVLGLPGNPVSACVTALLFLLPLVRAALGAAAPLPRRIAAELGQDLPATGGRAEFLRAIWDGTRVVPCVSQDSGAMRSLAAANALIIRDADASPARAGERIGIHLLENGGNA